MRRWHKGKYSGTPPGCGSLRNFFSGGVRFARPPATLLDATGIGNGYCRNPGSLEVESSSCRGEISNRN